jgi:hypothetical protein
MSDRPEIILGEFITFNTPILNEMHNQSPEISDAVTNVIGAIAKRYGIVPGATKPEPKKKKSNLTHKMQNAFFLDSKTASGTTPLQFAFTIGEIKNKSVTKFNAHIEAYVRLQKGIYSNHDYYNDIRVLVAETWASGGVAGMELLQVNKPAIEGTFVAVPIEEFIDRLGWFENHSADTWYQGKGATVAISEGVANIKSNGYGELFITTTDDDTYGIEEKNLLSFLLGVKTETSQGSAGGEVYLNENSGEAFIKYVYKEYHTSSPDPKTKTQKPGNDVHLGTPDTEPKMSNVAENTGNRPSPTQSAAATPEGQMIRGNNGEWYIVATNKAGTKQWKKTTAPPSAAPVSHIEPEPKKKILGFKDFVGWKVIKKTGRDAGRTIEIRELEKINPKKVQYLAYDTKLGEELTWNIPKEMIMKFYGGEETKNYKGVAPATSIPDNDEFTTWTQEQLKAKKAEIVEALPYLSVDDIEYVELKTQMETIDLLID